MFEINSDILEIKFTGNDIAPEAISLKEISDAIFLFDNLIRPILEEEKVDIDFSKSYIALKDLGNQSISLKYIIKQGKNSIITAYLLFLTSVNSVDVSKLPDKTINALDEISKFNERYNCKVEFGESQNGKFKSYAGFNTEFKSEKIPTLKGNTTVYGEVESVGGAVPHLLLISTSGEKIRIAITKEQASKIIAYSNVGISGEATWKGKGLILKQLVAKEIFPFDKLDPETGFALLGKMFSKYNLTTDNL